MSYNLDIRIGGVIDPSFVAERPASNRRVVCCTQGYFEHHGVPRTLDDLAQHNCVAFNLRGERQRDGYFQQKRQGCHGAAAGEPGLQ